jgi:hypothetical protein
VNLAAWTYTVMRRLYDNRSDGRAKRLEKEVLLPAVIGWRGRTLQETAREIDKYATNTGTNFKLWHRTNRPGVGGMYWRTGNRLRRR